MLGLMIGKLVYQWCNDDCVSVNDDLNYLFFLYQFFPCYVKLRSRNVVVDKCVYVSKLIIWIILLLFDIFVILSAITNKQKLTYLINLL